MDNRGSLVSLLVICALGVPAAQADRPAWSVGAGVSLGTYQLLGLGSLSGLGGLGGLGTVSTPVVNASLEYRPWRSAAMIFQLNAAYRNSKTTSAEGNEAESKQFGLGGAVGARWILNPDSVVEVGPYAMIRSGWERAMPSGEDTIDGWRLGGAIGLALDLRLMSRLFLRLSTDLIEAGHSRSTSSGDSESTFVGLSVRPQLDLRITF